MAKIKPLRPSLREKKRYIVFEIISKQEFALDEVKKAIIDSCKKYIGEFGYAKSNLYFIKNLYMPDKYKGVIRVDNKSVIPVKACLEMITEINDIEASIAAIGMSGILKKAKNKFLLKK